MKVKNLKKMLKNNITAILKKAISLKNSQRNLKTKTFKLILQTFLMLLKTLNINFQMSNILASQHGIDFSFKVCSHNMKKSFTLIATLLLKEIFQNFITLTLKITILLV